MSTLRKEILGIAANAGIAERRTRNIAMIDPSRAKPAKGIRRSTTR
ncbi:Uncharacterised protein [Mycobacteroides abscessus subsp. abscessus]|nr:Uncharacterised protein [Mycobacteroides abscessus subsp. abscessus]